MDIDLLSKMVRELILDNDNVALPGLGTFVAEMVPSTFSDRGYTINPPYRKLYFRAKPDEDNHLVTFYASSNDVSLEVADKVVRDFVAELKSILFVNKTVIFPGLGRLRATKENAIFFVADEDLDIFPGGIGLEPVSLKTHQESSHEISMAMEELKSIIAEPSPVQEFAREPVQEPTTGPAAGQSPEPEVSPEQSPEQLLDQTPVLTSDEDLTAVIPAAQQSKKKGGFWRCLGKTVLWVILVCALLLGAFVALSRFRPDITDKMLYTPEELEIIDHK